MSTRIILGQKTWDKSYYIVRSIEKKRAIFMRGLDKVMFVFIF